MKAPPHQALRHALVSSVGEDHFQAWDFSEQSLKQVRQALTVRIVCRSDQYAEQKAQCIGNHVSFSSFDLFAGITASAQTALSAGWDRLAVDDRSTGRGPPSFGHASGSSDSVLAIQMASASETGSVVAISGNGSRRFATEEILPEACAIEGHF